MLRKASVGNPSAGTSPCRPVRRIVAVLCGLAALGFAGCAEQPRQVAAGHSKEYFPSSIYGRASQRVVESGPVPRGGGQYLVGKPYSVAGHTYYPSERKLTQVGFASWYGDAFHGRLTANGEIYDRESFTAAHPTMPLPSYARVTNLRNNTSMIVRVNDRGPFASDRVMDVSRRVAEALNFERTGTAKVKIEYVARASLAGSDDAKLYATLRSNGPAQWRDEPSSMVAEAPTAARVASLQPMAPSAPPAIRREAEGQERQQRATERHVPSPARPPLPAESQPPQRRMGDRDSGASHRHEEPRPDLRWRTGAVAASGAGREARPPAHAQVRAASRAEPVPPRPPARGPTREASAPLPPKRGVGLVMPPHRGLGLRLARSRDD